MMKHMATAEAVSNVDDGRLSSQLVNNTVTLSTVVHIGLMHISNTTLTKHRKVISGTGLLMLVVVQGLTGPVPKSTVTTGHTG